MHLESRVSRIQRIISVAVAPWISSQMPRLLYELSVYPTPQMGTCFNLHIQAKAAERHVLARIAKNVAQAGHYCSVNQNYLHK